MLLSEQKNKFIGSVTPNTAWMLFIASLGILTAFLTMMYFDNKPEITSASTTIINPLSSDSTKSSAEALNDLTSQLMTERQLTNELHTKNEKLKQELQKSVADKNGNISAYEAVNEYLSALENIKKNKNLADDKISTTDDYNKVSITNNPNLLQNQINQFLENKTDGENIYLESLKVK